MVFVVGAQRSGARLPLQVPDASPDVSTFSEGADPYFDGVLLQPLEHVEELVRRSVSPVIALKPICETHRINELLDRFPNSRAIWIFRHYEDTVDSASRKWVSGRNSVRRLALREFNPGEWRAGGLTEEKLDVVSKLYRDDMTQHEANAVLWYLRSGLFFDVNADQRRDVLLVRYEDLVSAPHEHFQRVFGFLKIPVPTKALTAIRNSERPKSEFPPISREIRVLCEQLHQRLLKHERPHLPGSLAGVS